ASPLPAVPGEHIVANTSFMSYAQMKLEDQLHNVLPRVPVPLQEATVRLLSKDTRQRPTAQLLSLIKYFSDPAVHALQFLDVINMKDPTQKSHFYRNTLKEVLPYIPRVSNIFSLPIVICCCIFNAILTND
ncbi:hypothetical protein L9F63_020485, partial [Diploptera punctata]